MFEYSLSPRVETIDGWTCTYLANKTAVLFKHVTGTNYQTTGTASVAIINYPLPLPMMMISFSAYGRVGNGVTVTNARAYNIDEDGYITSIVVEAFSSANKNPDQHSLDLVLYGFYK